MQPRDVPWVYDIKVPNNSIVDALRQIGARYGFKSVSASAPFKLAADSSNANRLSKHIMYLPCGPGLTTCKKLRLSTEIYLSSLP